MEAWFRKMNAIGDGLYAQAYEDGQVIIVSDTSVRKVEDTWRRTWAECKEWAQQTVINHNAD